VLRTQNNTLTLLPSSGVVMSEEEDVLNKAYDLLLYLVPQRKNLRGPTYHTVAGHRETCRSGEDLS